MMPEPELTSLPPRQLRFYRSEDRQHADALVVEGRVRLSQLSAYQRLEDPSRNDRDEGEGRLRVPGDVPIVHLSLTDGRVTDGGTVASLNTCSLSPSSRRDCEDWVVPLFTLAFRSTKTRHSEASPRNTLMSVPAASATFSTETKAACVISMKCTSSLRTDSGVRTCSSQLRSLPGTSVTSTAISP